MICKRNGSSVANFNRGLEGCIHLLCPKTGE
jgi:hypothetical protein